MSTLLRDGVWAYPERDGEHRRHTRKRRAHAAVEAAKTRGQHDDRSGPAIRQAHPDTPSFANVCRTTSMVPAYLPVGAVCNLVLVKSKGCPAISRQLRELAFR